MKNHLKMCRLAISLVTLFRLVAFTASLWSGHNEARAAAKNVWIELPASTYTNSVNVTNCIGDTVYFEARTWWPEGASWSWSGATMTTPATYYYSYAQKTYLTAGGPFSVTATYGGDTSYAARMHVIAVASATASEGTEIDDGDGDPHTKTYVVCQGAGDVTVTATSNPSLTEEQLGNTCWCWGTTGGSGDDRLTRTVSKSECRSTSVTFSAGTSYKRVTVIVVCVGGVGLTEGNPIEESSPPTYVTCVGSGDVFAVAWPDPDVVETNLPACWSFTGGTNIGLGKLVRKVSKSTPGSTTFTATADTSSKCVRLHVLNVDILEPNNSPLTDNNFTFNQVADPDGQCNVTGTGTSGVASEDANLLWSLTAITGSTLTSNPNPPKGAGITFTYTRLPTSNAEFGNKTLTLEHPVAGCEDTQTVQIFFDASDAAKNHPGAGSGGTPNWFFYWLQTPAGYGSPLYNPFPQGGLTVWQNNQWVAYIGIGCNDNYTPPIRGDNWNNPLLGIDTFAWMCRHEARHVETATAWFPNGPNGAIDQDYDGMPNALEPDLGGTQENPQNGGPFTPGVWDTNGDLEPDSQNYTCSTQEPWTEGSADGQDWSNPGHQSNQ